MTDFNTLLEQLNYLEIKLDKSMGTVVEAAYEWLSGQEVWKGKKEALLYEMVHLISKIDMPGAKDAFDNDIAAGVSVWKAIDNMVDYFLARGGEEADRLGVDGGAERLFQTLVDAWILEPRSEEDPTFNHPVLKSMRELYARVKSNRSSEKGSWSVNTPEQMRDYITSMLDPDGLQEVIDTYMNMRWEAFLETNVQKREDSNKYLREATQKAITNAKAIFGLEYEHGKGEADWLRGDLADLASAEGLGTSLKNKNPEKNT